MLSHLLHSLPRRSGHHDQQLSKPFPSRVYPLAMLDAIGVQTAAQALAAGAEPAVEAARITCS
jgi:hypothetical protein